jgi:hypothetical protein
VSKPFLSLDGSDEDPAVSLDMLMMLLYFI